MSRVLPNPVTVGYPVKFESGGDTTSEAFHRHIQEIKRIYGYLQALDEGKVSADEVSGSLGNINAALTNHINSTNPHPNWKPSISWSDLINKPKLGDLAGDLDASRVVGKLTRATIDASKVDGLAKAIADKISEAGGSSGDGITEGTLSETGYVKFGNGLIVQWGKTERHAAAASSYTDKFTIDFEKNCYLALQTNKFPESSNDMDINIIGWSKSGITTRVTSSSSSSLATAYLYYLAIGE